MRACKNCRGDFIGILHHWINGGFLPSSNDISHLDPEKGFPVRVDGRIIMMTEEELEDHKNLTDDIERL